MIYSRANYIDRVEVTSFGRNVEEDATWMLIALRDIKQSMKKYCATQYEIKWRVRDQNPPVTDGNGDRVKWCKLQYVDDRWVYCHNNVCVRFTRNELKTSILYTRNGDTFVFLENLLNTIISILVAVGIPEQYLFTRKQKEFLINCGARRAMEERLTEISDRVRLLNERIERDSQQERDDETNQNLHLMRSSLESAQFDKDNAERFLAAINV